MVDLGSTNQKTLTDSCQRWITIGLFLRSSGTIMNNTKPDLDQLFSAEEIHSDKGYTESTLEKQAEFARKRNYHYTNTSNPIDFPEGFYDVGNLSLDDIKRKGRE
jgi:hypothetical protein